MDACLRGLVAESLFYYAPPQTSRNAVSCFESRDGELIDMLILYNTNDIYEKMAELKGKGITIGDIVELKRRITANLFGSTTELRNMNDTRTSFDAGIRKYPVTIGCFFVAETPEDVTGRLEEILAQLNFEPSSASNAFVTALNFHNDFEHLHPLTNADGRIGKLLMNFYLVRNGLTPIYVTSADKADYYESVNVFHLSRYNGAFITNMLSIACSSQSESLIERIESVDKNDPYVLELRDLILQRFGMINPDELTKDLHMVHEMGGDKDSQLTLAGLYLSGKAKLDTELVLRNFRHEDNDIQAMAMWAMMEINPAKYLPCLKSAVMESPSTRIRIAALTLIARNGLLDASFANMIAVGEEDALIKFALLRHLQSVKPSAEYIETIKHFLNSENSDLRAAAYGAAVYNSSKNTLIELLDSVDVNDSVIATVIVGACCYPQLSEMFMDNDVAISLSRIASGSEPARTLLLRTLSKFSSDLSLPDAYVDFCRGLLEKSSFESERAYALYVLGKQKGFDYIKERYSVGFGMGNSTLMNVVLTLVNMSDLESGRSDMDDALFDISDERLSMVIEAKAHRMIFRDVNMSGRLIRSVPTDRSDPHIKGFVSLVRGDCTTAEYHRDLTTAFRNVECGRKRVTT